MADRAAAIAEAHQQVAMLQAVLDVMKANRTGGTTRPSGSCWQISGIAGSGGHGSPTVGSIGRGVRDT
jgi:hypothetical protein